jgi:hypothetical protein
VCFDPWEHSAQKMSEDWIGHLREVELGRNVATNRWKADGFLNAIEEKYNDEDEFDVEELQSEVERLTYLADRDPRWLRLLELAEKALKKRADDGAMLEGAA